MSAASVVPHSRARSSSFGTSRSCLVTRKFSGSPHIREQYVGDVHLLRYAKLLG